jgi:hypothetical protein
MLIRRLSLPGLTEGHAASFRALRGDHAHLQIPIHEDGTAHTAEHDYQQFDEEQIRREAVIAGSEIAREVFSQGKVNEVMVDVSRDNARVMTATKDYR